MTNEIKKWFHPQNSSEIISWFHKYAIWLETVWLLKLKLWINYLINIIVGELLLNFGAKFQR